LLAGVSLLLALIVLTYSRGPNGRSH
jgi:hypothetical protein